MTAEMEPARFNFVRDVVCEWSAQTPEATALLWTDGVAVRSVTFAELAGRAAAAARALAQAGVQRGDAVIILMSREFPWWEIMLGCLQLGAVASPATTQLSAKDIRYRVEAAKARAVIANAACAEKVDAADLRAGVTRLLVGARRPGWTAYEPEEGGVAPSVGAEGREDALCYFTSGTTGPPKMTIHRHDYALGHRTTGERWLALQPGDLCWNLADTGWAKAAWSTLFAPWLCGATVFAYDAAAFDPKAVLDLLARHPVRSLCAPPTAYRMLLQEDLAASRFLALTHCVAAGEPLGPETVEAWRAATGLGIRVGYGQTETALLCADLAGEVVRPGAMGRPAPGMDLAIIDDAGRRLPPGEEGDIALFLGGGRPPGFFTGYRDEPERTAATHRGDWYLTGDRGVCDEDGYFWFVGRADDVILSSGYRIGPFEVESALNSHVAVMESAVVASPHPTRGEIVKAFVVLAPGWDGSAALAAALQDHVKAVTAPYKYPREISFLTSLPKTVSGKILRRRLRDAEWGRS